MTDQELDLALRERDVVLASGSGPTIAAYLRKWGEPEAAAMLERDEQTAWAGVHKARLLLPLSAEQHRISKQWLFRHGFRVEGC